jgi:acylphosphatase
MGRVDEVGVDVRVTGRVQGVAFRFHAEHQAAELGVAGWVRNEPDGSVALHVEGPRDAVDAMVAWCRRGPSSAVVEDVAVRDAEAGGARGFGTRF